MKPIKLNHLIAISVFFLSFTLFFTSPVITSFDSRWTIYTAMSIIKEWNTNLDEYHTVLANQDFYAIEVINGHEYSIFPIGTALVAVPFVWALDQIFIPVLIKFPGVKTYIQQRAAYYNETKLSYDLLSLHHGVELLIASFLCALTVGLLYLLMKQWLNWQYALLIALIFAFSTSVWSTASRALWQHGPSMLMLTLSLYLVVLAEKSPKTIVYTGLPLAFAFVIRPTNSIPIVCLSIYILLNYQAYFLRFILWAIPIAFGLAIYNFSVYNALISPYSSPGRILANSAFTEALLGQLVSPARGLFIYSPVLLFALYAGFTQAIFRPRHLNFYALLSIILHWLVIAHFPHWWGGHSFGPRLFTDTLPLWMLLLAQFVQIFRHYSRLTQWCVGSLLVLTILWSSWVHYQGAHVWATYAWNSIPNNIDTHPTRLWDWQDLPFLRAK
jgi:hypothetical protein